MELYIHIPFCIRKCAYCDFLSGPADLKTQEEYMKALLCEVALTGEEIRSCGSDTIETIFIGGGTPSAVDADWIVRLMDQVRASFVVKAEAEITMEANPGTLTADKLKQYRQAGINRLSTGLQSTDDGELARLGRIHTYEEFLENYRLARAAGFTNINIDLMSALPGQTVESYEETLHRVIALKPEHISAYSLIIEEGTPFGERYPERLDGEETSENERREFAARPVCWQLPTEDQDRQMYHLTKEILAEAGYERYEISNYARPGFECRHNIGYWTGVPYLGLGLGAASYYGGKRFSNTREMAEYLRILESQSEDPGKCLGQLHKELQVLTVGEAMEEFMFLGLRLIAGVSETEFFGRFGKSLREMYGSVLDKMERQGLLKQQTTTVFGEDAGGMDTVWHLTEMGLDVSNYVLAEFLF